MNELFQADKLLLFLIFFIPGFISLKVYKLIVASEKIDFANSIFEIVAFSSLNYAFFSWLILIITKADFLANHFGWTIFFTVIILFVSPTLWPFIVTWLLKRRWIKKFLLSPFHSPWDYFFTKRQSCWVIVHFKDGTRIGGVYGQNSYASAYPHDEKLYLEELWEIANERDFVKRIDRTNGVMILNEEIKHIEFYN
jgi:hypothetical protein